MTKNAMLSGTCRKALLVDDSVFDLLQLIFGKCMHFVNFITILLFASRDVLNVSASFCF